MAITVSKAGYEPGFGNWINTISGRQQKELLLARLRELSCEGWDDDDYDDDPDDIRQARKVIEAYDKKREKERAKFRNGLKQACVKVRREILFSRSPEEALAAVERLEKLASAKGWIKECE